METTRSGGWLRWWSALPVALAIYLASVCAWAAEATSIVRGTVAGQVPGNPVWVGALAGAREPAWTRAEEGRFEVSLPPGTHPTWALLGLPTRRHRTRDLRFV